MKKTILSIFIALLAISLQAQEQNISIFGKVIDSATGQPLRDASAFCPNTTYGTVSNAEGYFFLRLPNGGYDLMISYTGYEKKSMRISNAMHFDDTLIIALAKQDVSLSEVAIVATNEVFDGLEKYGKFFTDNFIGTTPNASLCFIQNPEVLHFFYSKKRNRLKVTATEDLQILNYALGYRIHYKLDSFSYNYNNNISQYTGSPLFEEIDTSRKVKAQWHRNRARTYLGSRLHFMQAMYDSTLSQEGFVVEKLNDDDENDIHGTVIPFLYDSSLYTTDSTHTVLVNWDGRYRISYTRVNPDSLFLREFRLPATLKAQVTILDVTGGFNIERNGFFYEQYDVINSGYWAWKKLAEQLPYDYVYF